VSIMILGCAGTGPCYFILHVGPEWSDKVKKLSRAVVLLPSDVVVRGWRIIARKNGVYLVTSCTLLL